MKSDIPKPQKTICVESVFALSVPLIFGFSDVQKVSYTNI